MYVNIISNWVLSWNYHSTLCVYQHICSSFQLLQHSMVSSLQSIWQFSGNTHDVESIELAIYAVICIWLYDCSFHSCKCGVLDVRSINLYTYIYIHIYKYLYWHWYLHMWESSRVVMCVWKYFSDTCSPLWRQFGIRFVELCHQQSAYAAAKVLNRTLKSLSWGNRVKITVSFCYRFLNFCRCVIFRWLFGL